MKTYVVVHYHNYGVSSYLVRSGTLPGEDQVVKALDLDFEPDKEEWIEIAPIDLTKIVTI